MSKYGNKKTEYAGVLYDSKKEAGRAQELNLLVRAGVIKDLARQVKYPLLVNGVKIGTYIADFVYVENGKVTVEDVKGYKTAIYRLKQKLLKAIYGIEIFET